MTMVRGCRLPGSGALSLDWRGWSVLLLGPASLILFVSPSWPRWLFMWALAGSIYLGCKWLTWRGTTAIDAPRWKHAAYLLAWPGMDAVAFLARPSRTPPDAGEWARAIAKFAGGIAVLTIAAAAPPMAVEPLVLGWVGMIGLVLTLHFGLFHLLSCTWRRLGVEARPLMDRPLASASIAEFWGRRWNTAFRDLTHRFLFRPLASCLGARTAIAIGFLVSGLVHDIVISIPSGGGYGGPTLFFGIQGTATLFERSAAGRQIGLGCGIRGRAFVALVLVAPVPLLFHAPFVERIVVPFVQAMGQL